MGGRGGQIPRLEVASAESGNPKPLVALLDATGGFAHIKSEQDKPTINRGVDMSQERGEAVGAITRLPIGRVHPDPLQPRKNVDSDLADSILHNGQQVPITVWVANGGQGMNGAQYMILNGERRYRGCVKAGLTDIDTIIVPEPSKAERMMKQVIANQGKDLTAVEEAFAFRQIMADNKWSQNELSKRLGIPRSTVGDRIRLIELHPSWLDLIEQGKLQIAHAPLIHKYRDVEPPEAHEKAVAWALGDKSYRIGAPIRNGEIVQVNGQFASDLFSAYSHWLRDIKDVPSYVGPTVKGVGRYSHSDDNAEFAANRKVWLPIFNKIKKEAKLNGTAAPSASSKGWVPRDVQQIEALCKERGLPLASLKGATANDNEVVVWKGGNWLTTIDPADFMGRVQNEKLRALVLIPEESYNSPTAMLMTTDTEAVELAKASLDTKRAEAERESSVAVLAKIDELMPDYAVFGPGCRAIVTQQGDYQQNQSLSVLASMMGIDYDAFFTIEENREAIEWKCQQWHPRSDEVVERFKNTAFCTKCAENYEDLEEDERATERVLIRKFIREGWMNDEIERFAAAWLMVLRGTLKVPTEQEILSTTLKALQPASAVTVHDDDDVDDEDEEEDGEWEEVEEEDEYTEEAA